MRSGWWWLCLAQASLAGWLGTARPPVARRLLAGPPPGPAGVTRAGGIGAWSRRCTHLVLDRLRSGRAAARRRAAVGDLLATVAAELRTGAPPRDVLARAAAQAGLREVAVAASHPAGDPVASLDLLSQRPGAQTAADLSALWRVSELTGCSLVEPVTRLLAGHRAEERLRRQVDAALAGPRSTARLLALLPVAGVCLGLTLGADPMTFLLGSPAGLGCLAGGALLVGLGLVWSRAVVRSALPSSRTTRT